MFVKLPLEKSFDDYIEDLVREKYKCIGSGDYGQVFATKSGKHVIKIGYRTGVGLDKWVDFAKGIIGTDNPFLPKIEHMTLYGHYNNPNAYYVAKMERLREATNKMREEMPHVIAVAITNDWRSEKRLINIIGDYYTYNKVMRIFDIIGGQEMMPEFLEAMKTIRRIKNRCGAGEDMHSENIMRRGKQLVITDPIY